MFEPEFIKFMKNKGKEEEEQEKEEEVKLNDWERNDPEIGTGSNNSEGLVLLSEILRIIVMVPILAGIIGLFSYVVVVILPWLIYFIKRIFIIVMSSH
jgi:hypothetical protein